MGGRLHWIGAIAVIVGSCFPLYGKAGEPGWSGVVIARGKYFRELQTRPIHERPYRPFHFVGNTIRRRYYRGTPLPTPQDLNQGVDVLLSENSPIAR